MADQRGQGSGMSTTTQNSAMVLSIGIFFTLIITGLAASLTATLYKGLTAQGVPAAAAARVAHLPPTATVFGAFLGYNPIANLLGPSGVLAHLPHARAAYLTGRSFFPDLISGPFSSGLHEAFDFAIVAMLIAAAASWLRGKPTPQPDPVPAPSAAAAGRTAAISNLLTVTVRAASCGDSPARASRYARWPSTLIALTPGGIWLISPVSPSMAGRSSASPTLLTGTRLMTEPCASSVSVLSPSLTVPVYSFSVSAR